MKRATLQIFIIFLAAILISGTAPAKFQTYVFAYENVLGTSLDIKISASGPSHAAAAEQRILAEIDRLNGILSGYLPSSEFSRWSASNNKPVQVSEDLYAVLEQFEKWQIETAGALNPAAEVVGRVWKQAAAANSTPNATILSAAAATASAAHWELDPVKRTAIRLDRVPLKMNTFVKGYIINKAVEKALQSESVNGIVLNIGGDILVRGIGVEQVSVLDPRSDAENSSPMAIVNVQNRAIATSGDYRRGYNVAGKWYSHIVDPRTGWPASEVISATVIAADAATAGALATAFNVLTPEASQKLAARYQDVDYLLVDKDGNRYESADWNKITHKALPAAGDTQAPKYELLINIELALVQGQRIYRPFVAFWIESEDRKPIRNIAVWYNKPRWLPDLKSWYRAYGLDFDAAAGAARSISSATRTPGKYTIKWDGLDDSGKPVKPGNYIVNIEVVREHGTYQLLSKKMNFNNSAQKYTLPENVEVAAASLEYRRKAK